MWPLPPAPQPARGSELCARPLPVPPLLVLQLLLLLVSDVSGGVELATVTRNNTGTRSARAHRGPREGFAADVDAANDAKRCGAPSVSPRVLLPLLHGLHQRARRA